MFGRGGRVQEFLAQKGSSCGAESLTKAVSGSPLRLNELCNPEWAASGNILVCVNANHELRPSKATSCPTSTGNGPFIVPGALIPFP